MKTRVYVEEIQEVERFENTPPLQKIPKNHATLNLDSCYCPDNLMFFYRPMF
jgi:hypothetical protein